MTIPIADGHLLADLLALPGPSGYETPVRDFIVRCVEGLGTAHVDPIGNLTVSLGADGPHVLFAAHMDEVGLQVTHVEENGLLRFTKIGTIDDRVILGTPVVVHTAHGSVHGVTTVPPASAPPGARTWQALAIDIGVRSRAAAETLGIVPGLPVTFRRQPVLLNRRYLSGWALDDRWGCFAMIKLLRHAAHGIPKGRLTFAWTVQEEVGLRGAQALAARHRFDVVFVIDGFVTSAAPGHRRFLAYAELGRGPVLRLVDHGAIASRRLAAWVEELAGRHGIPVQAGCTGGETDGKPLQMTGAHMLPLGLAMRYAHSAVQMLHLDDLEHLIALGQAILDELDGVPVGV
jgi:putative aminopeptidase FrvX